MTGIFISYRQEDAKPWALLLRKELAEVFGDKWVFLDKDTLHAGNWRAQIHAALNQCRVVLVVIGRNWLTITDETGLRRLNRSDDVHRQEIALALSRKEVTVIPVRVDGVAMPRAEDLPTDIRSLSDQQSRELSDTSGRRELDMQLLIEDIRRITGLEGKRKERTSLLAGLRALLLTTVAIAVLTVAVSVFFYITPPSEPLTPAETTVVLGASIVVVLAAKRIWGRLHKGKEEKMRGHIKITSFFCFLLTYSIFYQGSFAQSLKGEAAPSQFIVGCSPEKPIARPGETLRLKAFAAPPAGKPLNYSWSSLAGRVDGQGPEVHWDFTDVPAGIYEAKVRVSDGGSRIADCSVRVIVQSQSRLPTRGNRETGRSFLVSGEPETTGYGLYSYLLLGSPPTAASRERYLKAIEEYLRFPDLTRLETFNIPYRTLNITYLPIKVPPERPVLDQLADERYGEVAAWILKQYDYERARVLLKNLPGSHREGPYFLSVLRPPSWDHPPPRPYLYQDQSAVPPHLVSLWAREFLNQAAQEQFWQERTAAHFALKLRTSIGILATGLPEVRKALDYWIAWVS